MDVETLPKPMPNKGGRPKGQPKTGGRVKGKWSEQHKEARELFSTIVNDPRYIESVSRRALAGKLAPAVEVRILDYVYGRPAETINATIGVAAITASSLRHLSGDELAQAMEASRAAVGVMALLTRGQDADETPGDNETGTPELVTIDGKVENP